MTVMIQRVTDVFPIPHLLWEHEPYGDSDMCTGCGLEPDFTKEFAFGEKKHMCQWCLGLLLMYRRNEGQRVRGARQAAYEVMCLRHLYGDELRRWGWL